jgi:predicted ribosome quality control (RQC) complex YloA/Tae2 family protein
MVGSKLSAIKTFPFDRSFSLYFDNYEILRFYGYGKFSQLTHYKSDKWLDNFPLKSKQISFEENIKDVNLSWLIEGIKVEELKFLDSSQKNTLIVNNFDENLIDNKKKSLMDIYHKSLTSSLFINKINLKYELAFEKRGETISAFDSTLHACDQFARLYISHQVFVQTKLSHLNVLNKERQRILKRLKSVQIQIKELSNGQKYKDKADLIMANLWQMDKGMDEINLQTFDGKEQVFIKLKKDLSPQDNAARLYKKGKNEKIRLKFANETLKIIKQELTMKTEEIASVEQMDELKDLRKEANSKQGKQFIKLPYRVVRYEGFEIRIGKGARENDELLRNYTTKFDKWLHAKDVSGSHVVIRNPSQNQISMDVIERAAQLAAYYSKAKNEGMAAVIYTDRKYVRKPKGAHPGMVKVDREYTILVEPQQ